MAKQITIDEADYLRLLEALDYAIVRLDRAGDVPAIEYLSEQKGLVVGHVSNEQFGGGDLTCVQIDLILGLLGEDDG